MSAAVLRKTLRDSLPIVLLVFGGLVLFEILFMRAMGEIPAETGQSILQIPVLRNMIKLLVGADLLENLTATSLMSIGFIHPLLLTLNWALLLTVCTRVIAGEIDRGTADLLLTLPVSRISVYTSVSAVWISAGLLISYAPLLGAMLGEQRYWLWQPLQYDKLAILCVNLFAMYLAVGGITMLASATATRRGPAIGAVLAALLASFLLNFLAQYWKEVEVLDVFSILHYYKPLPVVRTGHWPVRDIAILCAIGAVAWMAGLIYFRRRDIPAT
jgi:ABC-2 type transport system permease protein